MSRFRGVSLNRSLLSGNRWLVLAVVVATGLSVSMAAQTATVIGSRIIGGSAVTSGSAEQFPFMASLRLFGYHHCGGSIINARTVLTAAHCVTHSAARLMQVHVGARTHSAGEGLLVPAAAVHYHSQWNSNNMDYDVGVVRLADALQFSNAVQPVRLAAGNAVVADGSMALVAGWGYTTMLGPGSDVLRSAPVSVINRQLCNRILSGMVTPRMLCAGYLRGGIDACQMDSGGPLLADGRLVGIVSWGIGCALPNRPGIYTDVAAVLPWLETLLALQYNETL